MLAVVAGAVVWLAIGGALTTWLLVTFLAGRGRLPSVVDVLRWFLSSWAGRLLVVASWAELGWHLFTQRP